MQLTEVAGFVEEVCHDTIFSNDGVRLGWFEIMGKDVGKGIAPVSR